MLSVTARQMLTSMSEVSWSDPDMDALMSELPTGTVTLLLADVEGSTRLWETQADVMKVAVDRLDQALSHAVAAHHGVRPVEQGEGDSFVIAFPRAADAVDCALDLQRAPLAPIKLRIGLHTGDIQLRGEGNYIGPTINRTARLRDLAHGGQTVLSGATEPLVIDQLPDGVTLTDLGTHQLRDLPRPERVVQLCHPDLRNEFPPLRVANAVAMHNLPIQLTSFVGRTRQIADVSELLSTNRLLTLTGAGGAGKTRLAVEVAAHLTTRTPGGVWYVDLAPITHADVVPVATARALGLPDDSGQSTVDTLIRFIADQRLLLVLDNCEHLLDASASLATEILKACPEVRLLTTSREPIGVPGEVTFVVPSLPLADEAIRLFTDRARRAQPDFAVTDDNAKTLAEICRRLDGMPLAIELAAARVRALTLDEILGGLHDRFRLLTGGARRAVRRQQTLHASVDWSHALLTQTERVLFRRLSVFLGGFDLQAAHAVAGDAGVERYQVLDQLTLLVDKSLLNAENSCGRTRYRFLETVRQYALEKSGESGEAEMLGVRHRDYFTSLAAELDGPGGTNQVQRLQDAEIEIDNLRGAFAWSFENRDTVPALLLAASLQPLWFSRWCLKEGLGLLDAALSIETRSDAEHDAARVRALAGKGLMLGYTGSTESTQIADEALALARETTDPALVMRALVTHGTAYAYEVETARTDFAEASALARELGDRWMLSQILCWRSVAAMSVGDHGAIHAAASEGCELAEALGDESNARLCRVAIGTAHLDRGEVRVATAPLREVVVDATAAHDVFCRSVALVNLTFALAWQGDVDGAQAAVDDFFHDRSKLGELVDRIGYSANGLISLMRGDAIAAREAYEAALQRTPLTPVTVTTYVVSALPWLACGDLSAARRRADEVVAASKDISLVAALATRARVAIAQGEFEQAGIDALEALDVAAESHGYVTVPDAFECLAYLAVDANNQSEAARLFGMAESARQQTGIARFKVLDAEHERRLANVRNQLGESDFRAASDEGASLTIEEAIAYIRRGRGERKRNASGWSSLTRAELDVVKLVSEGLGNKDVAARLFVSPRTVQAHLTHIYAKLGLASRVQLAQEAARH